MFKPALTLLILNAIVEQSFAYFITVDAHAEECFFDKVETATKLGKLFVPFITLFSVT